MPDTIDFGSLQLDFLQSKEGTDGSLDLFEMTVHPNARMPVPHYHRDWDETVYGLVEATTWTVAGRDVVVGPGETLFIKRGTVHGFRNDGERPAKCLNVLTPGALGPTYFEEMAALARSGAPDEAKMTEVMLRYGLVPSPQ